MFELIIDKIEIVHGDIFALEVDAIVNSCNPELIAKDGLDKQVHNLAGEKLEQECRDYIHENGELAYGEAIISSSDNMKAKYIIHTAGPEWDENENFQEEILALCYYKSLVLAEYNGISSLAIPNICTGLKNFPKDLAAETAFREVLDYLLNEGTIEKIIFVCHNQENFEIYESLYRELKDQIN